MIAPVHDFKVRAVTAFLHLATEDFESHSELRKRIELCAKTLRNIVSSLESNGYEVQTYRIATNPFYEFLPSAKERLKLKFFLSQLDEILKENDIQFFAVGNALSIDDLECIPDIISTSQRFSCSVEIRSGQDTELARSAAECMKKISRLGELDEFQGMAHVANGLGNFRFCTTSSCKPFTPFFPAARSNSDRTNMISFALGFENGKFARTILKEAGTLEKIPTIFKDRMTESITKVVEVCQKIERENSGTKFIGVDTSLNPSLQEDGSIASAIETIDLVDKFGGRGSIAVIAAITECLKTMPNIPMTGYCGLMLPVCEDQRLAQLASSGDIDTTKLLALSSVCGVGLDTVPIPGNATIEDLMGLILDVASLAHRYDKSLSCRVFPCPGLNSGDKTDFSSPYMCDCSVFKL